jgi:PAS domain S-box-containing protein
MTDLRHPLVLIVDDDLDTCDLYRMVLESVGYRVEESGNVRGAIAAAGHAVPDVVLTDWLLPDGDGLEVCRALRSHRPTRRVPVIAVTGLSLDQAAEANAHLEGIAAILRKPANPDDILAAIQVALTKVGERRLCDAATRTRRYAAQARRRAVANGCAAEAALDPRLLLQRAALRSGDSIALVIVNDAGYYLAASGATRELTGYDAAELAGLTVWDLAPEADAVDPRGLWRQFIATGAQQGRYLLRRRDGQAVDAQYCALANIAPGWHVSAIAELPDLPITLGAV